MQIPSPGWFLASGARHVCDTVLRSFRSWLIVRLSYSGCDSVTLFCALYETGCWMAVVFLAVIWKLCFVHFMRPAAGCRISDCNSVTLFYVFSEAG